MIVVEDLVPQFPRGVRLKHDKARGQWVILAPERMFALDDIAQAIMQQIDGEKNVSTIVDALAETFQAPRDLILQDVLTLMQDFADKGVLSS